MVLGAWCWVLLQTAAPQTPAQQTGAQQPRFSSNIERIVIDVQVIDRDSRPIPRLSAQDFDVRFDRQPRTVASAQFIVAADLDSVAAGASVPDGRSVTSAAGDSRGGRDFILAIDEASFRTIDAPAAIRAARAFVRRLAPNDRVGLYTFPVSPRYFALTPDHTSVSMALNRVIGTFQLPRSHFHLSPSEVIDILAGDTDLVRAIARRECLPQSLYQGECMKGIPGDATLMVEAYESQASASIMAMRKLFAALHQDPQRKTVVLLSGGLLASDRVGGRPDIADIVDRIGAEAAKADANLYVLHMDSSFLQTFSATSSAVAPRSQMRESAALASGLERLAGTAGGAMVHVEPGAEDRAFERILRETSAYYLLSIEPLAGDRDGRLHYISVKTNVRGAEVRARRTVVIPADQPRTSRYFSAPPVLNSTTVSEDAMTRRATSCLSAVSAAPPSGAALMPSFAPSSFMSRTMSASLTAIAVPPLSRTARRTRKSPIAFGTRRPSATVRALGNISDRSFPWSNARTIGAQCSACTDTIFGRRPGSFQPIASISSKAFHMPTMPVPPPVG